MAKKAKQTLKGKKKAQVKIYRRQRLMLCEGVTSTFAWRSGVVFMERREQRYADSG